MLNVCYGRFVLTVTFVLKLHEISKDVMLSSIKLYSRKLLKISLSIFY